MKYDDYVVPILTKFLEAHGLPALPQMKLLVHNAVKTVVPKVKK